MLECHGEYKFEDHNVVTIMSRRASRLKWQKDCGGLDRLSSLSA